MDEPDVTRHRRYARARDATLGAVARHAEQLGGHALDYPLAAIAPEDLLRTPQLALAALLTPARHWQVAMGQVRPASPLNLVGHLRFRLSVRRAKAEIRQAVDLRYQRLRRALR